VQQVTAWFLLGLLLLAAPAGECAGWQSSPGERMACCAGADHDCSSQASADDCCSRTEQDQQQEPAAAALVTPVLSATPLPPFDITLEAGAQRSAASAFIAALQGRPVRPAYILTATLLI
jgi:hypothetical protein